jgi:hypothetical protein
MKINLKYDLRQYLNVELVIHDNFILCKRIWTE